MKRGRFVYYRSPGFEADLLRHHLSGQIRILPTAMETIPFYILFYQRTSLPGWPCSPMPCNGWQTAASWLTSPSATLKRPFTSRSIGMLGAIANFCYDPQQLILPHGHQDR